jgi:hypothetical protein
LQLWPVEQEGWPLVLRREIVPCEGIDMSRVRHRPFLCFFMGTIFSRREPGAELRWFCKAASERTFLLKPPQSVTRLSSRHLPLRNIPLEEK